MARNSRYKNARLFLGSDSKDPVFPGHRPRQIGEATGVIEHLVVAGDRLDLLANNYYNDERLWWRIVDANPEVLYGRDLIRSESYPLPADSDPPADMSIDAQKKEYLNETVLHSSMVGQVIRIPRGKE